MTNDALLVTMMLLASFLRETLWMDAVVIVIKEERSVIALEDIMRNKSAQDLGIRSDTKLIKDINKAAWVSN